MCLSLGYSIPQSQGYWSHHPLLSQTAGHCVLQLLKHKYTKFKSIIGPKLWLTLHACKDGLAAFRSYEPVKLQAANKSMGNVYNLKYIFTAGSLQLPFINETINMQIGNLTCFNSPKKMTKNLKRDVKF